MMSPVTARIVLVLVFSLTLAPGGFGAGDNLEPAGAEANKTTAQTCRIKCEIKKQYLDISFYKVGGQTLKNYLYVCETEGAAEKEVPKCILDLDDVTRDTPHDFVATSAVIVKCLFPAELLIINPKGVRLKTISMLELRHCAVAWSHVATFGKALGLRGLRLFQPLYVTNDLELGDFVPTVIPTNHIFPPIPGFDRSKYKLARMVNGIHTLGKIEIQNPKPCGKRPIYPHCFNPGKRALRVVSLPDIFTQNIWPEMAELVLRDMNLTSSDITGLPFSMPFLQSFNILRNTESFDSFPQFPWCNNNMFLPNAMTRTESGLEQYNEGADIPPNLHRRFFQLEFLTPQPAVDIKFEGALDKIILNKTIVSFGNKPPSPFEGAYGLQSLLLPNNRITNLPDHAFHGNSGIKRIDLTNNYIMGIGSTVFRGHLKLDQLFLSTNRINRLGADTFSDLVNLTILDLSHNFLTSIKTGTFSSMGKLKKLSLNDNRISSIEKGALPDTRHNVLMQLDLQNNRLKTLSPEFVMFPFASKIDLSNNGIASRDFMNLLALLKRDVISDVMRAPINQSDYEAVLFTMRGSRVRLSLINNSIDNLDIKSLDSPESKSLEWFLSYFMIDLTGNPINCECKIYPWYSFIKKHRKDNPYESYAWLSFARDTWLCTKPSHLKGRPLEDVKEDEFQCPFTGSFCPEPCQCFDRLKNDVTLVLCHDRNLTTLPEVMPGGLLELHFEDNDIAEIPPRPYLCNVTGLHMARNDIENISPDIAELLSTNANKIHLQENKIDRITENVTKLFNNVTELNILRNTLVCECSTKWLSDWVRADYIVEADDLKCIVGEEVKTLSSLTPEDFACPVPGPKVQVIAGIAAGVILLLLLIGTFLPAVLKGKKKKEDEYVMRTSL